MRVAKASGIEVLRTPYQAPRANAYCERLLGSIRRECLDHILVLSEAHLYRIVKEYVNYYNSMRPHQGIGQSIPNVAESPVQVRVLAVQERSWDSDGADRAGGKVISLPVLGGLHHDYRRAA
jgi:putative transposase